MASTPVAASLTARRAPARPSFDAAAALMFAAFVAVPASFIALALDHGGALIVIPYQHFYIVSAVSLIAALVAGVFAVTTIQIGMYRVLFLCLGYMSMGAIFAVHGL